MLVLFALTGDDHRASHDSHKTHAQIQGDTRVAGVTGLHVLTVVLLVIGGAGTGTAASGAGQLLVGLLGIQQGLIVGDKLLLRIGQRVIGLAGGLDAAAAVM